MSAPLPAAIAATRPHLSRDNKAERFDGAPCDLEGPGDLVLADIESAPGKETHATLCESRQCRRSELTRAPPHHG